MYLRSLNKTTDLKRNTSEKEYTDWRAVHKDKKNIMKILEN